MTTAAIPVKHSDHQPWEPGTRVAGNFQVWVEATEDFKFSRRTATIVAFDADTNGGYGLYTLRFADGTEDQAHPAWLTLAPERKPKNAPKAPRAKVDKPDPATLPRIIAFADKTDAGEYGADTCPHCGADGRYVYHFHCADGTRRGAMAGCLQHFPVSPVAEEHKRILDRQADRTKKGGQLASWDEAKLEAINQLIAGTVTEDDALRIIRSENAKRQAWLDRRGRR